MIAHDLMGYNQLINQLMTLKMPILLYPSKTLELLWAHYAKWATLTTESPLSHNPYCNSNSSMPFSLSKFITIKVYLTYSSQFLHKIHRKISSLGAISFISPVIEDTRFYFFFAY